jgi:hypothetical protein
MVGSNRIKCIHRYWTNKVPVDIYHPDLVTFVWGDGKHLGSSLSHPKFSRGNDGAPRP